MCIRDRYSAQKFRHTLSSFTPHDLRDDLRYMEFVESLQSEIESTELKQSTLNGYLGYLTGKVLKYGKVKPRIVEEVKTQVTLIKKGLKRREASHRGIEEDEIGTVIGTVAGAGAGTKARVRVGNLLGVRVHRGKEGGIAIAQTAPVKAKSIAPIAPINRGKARA